MDKPCPRCKTPVPRGTPSSPFCSRRCQQADLGAWLTEEYRIPAGPPEEDEDGDASPGVPTMRPPDGDQ